MQLLRVVFTDHAVHTDPRTRGASQSYGSYYIMEIPMISRGRYQIYVLTWNVDRYITPA